MKRILTAVKAKLKDMPRLLLFWKPHFLWLYRNRHLRMDANVAVNNKIRRQFHIDRYIFAVDHLNTVIPDEARILDAACGTGYGSDILKRIPSAQITGIDIDAEAVCYAAGKYGDGRATFRVSNVVEMTDFGNELFDAVVSFETIEHLEQPLLFLKNVHRVLKPQGIMVISTPNKWGLTRDHKFDYDYPMLLSHLENFFVIDDIWVQNSGSMDLWINRGQQRRIVKATPETIEQAECFIAVCRKK
mgnify:CR=1 FL=1